jgi:hypothetical protein
MADKKVPPHWADIQQNAFTRWVNEHLKERGLHVNDLKVPPSDFSTC